MEPLRSEWGVAVVGPLDIAGGRRVAKTAASQSPPLLQRIADCVHCAVRTFGGSLTVANTGATMLRSKGASGKAPRPSYVDSIYAHLEI